MHTQETVTNAIVILAYRLSDSGKMQTPLIKRIEMGMELYQRSAAPKPAIIVCGWRANKRKDLGRYNEAELMREYIHERYGREIPVLVEPDSTSIQENLLFTRKRFPKLKQLTVVTAHHALARTQYHGSMVFTGNAKVTYVGCEEGVNDPELEAKMLGDVQCMLRALEPEMKSEMKSGRQWERLMLPSQGGRMRSIWNDLRDKHHATCRYYKHLHPPR